MASIRVLLIDDEHQQYVYVRTLLDMVAPGAYDVRWASNYTDGLRQIEAGAADVVLVDYRLGASSGMELIGIAARRLRGEVPLIMLTGHGDRGLDLQAMESGAAEYLSKAELTPELLDRTLRYAVRHANTIRLLRESEERFRALIQNTWDAILVLDPAFTITFASESTGRVTGLTNAELVGHDACALLHPADAERIRGEMRTLVANPGGRMSTECRSRHKDGSWRECELVAVNRLDDPAVNGIVVNYRDVTERRRSESEYRALFDASPIGMAHVSLDGRWVRVNRRLAAMLGYSEQELQTLRTEDVCHPDDEPETPAIIRQLVAGSLPRFESERRYRRKSGDFIWVRVHAELQREADGMPRYIVAAVQDISERKAAEERLRHTLEQLQAVVSAVPMSLWAVDADGIITFTQGRLLERFGLQPGELVGKSQLELYRDKPELLDPLLRALDGEPVHYTAPFDNGVFETWYTPLFDDERRPIGAIGITMDITDRVRLEEQFRQAQKMEAVGRLAGGVAHDFNNLLTAIIGYGELAASALPADSEVRGDVDQILKAGHSAAALTQQLLAFSRRQVLQPQVVTLNEVISRVKGLLSRVIGEDIAVRTVLAPDLAPIYADPSQLEQILMNLAVNARDAMPGGGQLTIETANVPDTEPAPAPLRGAHVLLKVSDTGTGMNEEVQRRLFEPFFTTKERGKGTGLGLATVYGIVNQSGGTIEVQSEVGKGASFMIRLPTAGADARDHGQRDERTIDELAGTETILLVEDQDEVRGVARSTLERSGYHVIEAATPDQAIALAADPSLHVDLLLTDIVMPGMSGRVLAQRLRGPRPDLKVLYTSGYTEDRIVQRGVTEAGLPFVQKPFTPAVLLAKVREVLDAKSPGNARVQSSRQTVSE